MKKQLLAAAVLAFVISIPALVTLRAQGQPAAGLPDFVGALKTTPGVLGVEAARTQSGKEAIFAWFENKKAALAWYYSDTHQALVMQFAGGKTRPGEPLAGVPDDGRPILAIASLTMPAATAPKNAGDLRHSVTQIAIELYAPLPGGLAVGGRFAPSSVSAPGMLEVPVEALSFVGPR